MKNYRDNESPLKFILLLLLIGLTLGCVQLPDHAKPRLLTPGVGGFISGKGFSYRQLTIKDFQAKSLPADYRQYNHSIGAQSCISIQPVKDSRIRIVRSYYQNRPLYTGTLSGLSFGAIFDPECSWWNPGITRNKEKYVLQHEQIHFALVELSARKLTRKAASEVKDYLAIGNTSSEIREELVEKLKSMMLQAMQESIGEQTEFDKDTSLTYAPRVQQKWLQNVNARLAE